MSRPNTTTPRILTALNARKVPLTMKQLAAFTRRDRLSVHANLKALRANGSVIVYGTRSTGRRGRPALLYAIPAQSVAIVPAV